MWGLLQGQGAQDANVGMLNYHSEAEDGRCIPCTGGKAFSECGTRPVLKMETASQRGFHMRSEHQKLHKDTFQCRWEVLSLIHTCRLPAPAQPKKDTQINWVCCPHGLLEDTGCAGTLPTLQSRSMARPSPSTRQQQEGTSSGEFFQCQFNV